MVSRLEQVGLQVVCEKEALAPEGNPDAEKETGWGDPVDQTRRDRVGCRGPLSC